MKKEIKYIPTIWIKPHPDNPRKDLGDLTELVESIKQKGILQNLTIVPEDGHYTVIIGHRRLAAAKLAGLTEVPCVVTIMDKKEQLATMLLENMQRSDLTIYEEAKGMQMLLDLGESIKEVSAQTGLSESTVRRRVKLLDLDQAEFKKSVLRGATLMDYAELDKIKSVELKNKVLESIGTDNFKWELSRAIEREKYEARLELAIEVLKTFAKECSSDTQGLIYVTSYWRASLENIEIPDDIDTEKYYYVINEFGVTLFREDDGKTKEKIDAEQEKREKREIRTNKLEQLSERARKLRREFAYNVSNTTAKENINMIANKTIELLSLSYARLNEEATQTIQEKTSESQAYRKMWLMLYELKDRSYLRYFDYEGDHEKDKSLDELYEELIALGYEMSDEEKALQDGTHELFKEG